MKCRVIYNYRNTKGLHVIECDNLDQARKIAELVWVREMLEGKEILNFVHIQDLKSGSLRVIYPIGKEE